MVLEIYIFWIELCSRQTKCEISLRCILPLLIIIIIIIIIILIIIIITPYLKKMARYNINNNKLFIQFTFNCSSCTLLSSSEVDGSSPISVSSVSVTNDVTESFRASYLSVLEVTVVCLVTSS